MRLSKRLLLFFVLSLNVLPVIASENYHADIRYLYVQKGQTLHNIVKRLYPGRVKQWPEISTSIVRQNPHAFVNNDPTRLKAGIRLTLPQKTVVRAIPTRRAKKDPVGVVVNSKGSVIAVDKRKVSRKLESGYPVFLGDKVITGENGSVRLRMIDEAILDIGCFSIMVIEEYALNTNNRKSILNLLQGSLRKVTGTIGKLTKDVYELKTPLASVGVRGTEYALRVFQSKGCGGTIDTDDGLYLEVIKGLVNLYNKAGNEMVAKGETAYVPLPESAPRKTEIKQGVLTPVVKTVVEQTEQESGIWWWVLGVVAIALLI